MRSAAPNVLPLWNSTPGRSLTSYSVASLLAFHSNASPGPVVRSGLSTTSGSYRFCTRDSSIGVTPWYGLIVSAVPPPLGFPADVVAEPPEPEPPQAAARSGDIPTIAPAAPRRSVPREMRRRSSSVLRSLSRLCGSVTVSLQIGLRASTAHSRIRPARAEVAKPTGVSAGPLSSRDAESGLNRQGQDRYALIPILRMQGPRLKGPNRGRHPARVEPRVSRGPSRHAGRRDRLLRREYRRAPRLEGRRGRDVREHRRFPVGRRARLGRRNLRHPGRQRPRQRRFLRSCGHPARRRGRLRRAPLLQDRGV